MVATSTNKIYIRKDINSPSTAIPMFSPKGGDGQAVNLLANLQERLVQTDQGPIVLSTPTSSNTDLSTLANVVTTLALMGKPESDQQPPVINGNQSTEDVNQSVAKAFDTLAKAVQHADSISHENNTSADHSGIDMDQSTTSDDNSMVIDIEDKSLGDRVRAVIEHILKLQSYIQKMQSLQVDNQEYSYLKALLLFSPDNPSLPSMPLIEKFQERIQRELQQYLQESHPDSPDRLAKLLLRLPPLQSLQANIMEELFFAGLIGNVQIDSIIPYILRMESAEYNSQMASQGLQTTVSLSTLSESTSIYGATVSHNASSLFLNPQMVVTQSEMATDSMGS